MTGSSSLVGQTISHYRITERIGAGGTCIGKASSIGTLSRERICSEASFLRRSHAKLCRYFAKLCLTVSCPRMPYGAKSFRTCRDTNGVPAASIVRATPIVEV